MVKMKTSRSLFFLILTLLFAGCGDDIKRVNFQISIEPIESVYIGDANITNEDVHLALQDTLSRELKYHYGLKKGSVVDNNVYNFLVHYKMILKEDIFSTINFSGLPMTLYTCENDLQSTNGIRWVRSNEKISGKYVFEGYSNANDMAQENMLDDIKELCLKIDVSEKTTDILGNLKGYEYTSNIVRIPAQEVKDMLDGLGVPYDE